MPAKDAPKAKRKMSQKSLDNLMPIQEVNSRRSREKHSADSSKGGTNSVKVRNMKKDAREAAQNALYSMLINDAGKRALKRKGLSIDEDADIVGLSALMGGLLAEGIKGNAQCAKLLLEMADAVNAEEETKESDQGGVVIIPEVKYE